MHCNYYIPIWNQGRMKEMIEGRAECRQVHQRCGIQLLIQIKLISSIGFPGSTSHLSLAPIQYIVSTEQLSGWDGKPVNLDTEPIRQRGFNVCWDQLQYQSDMWIKSYQSLLFPKLSYRSPFLFLGIISSRKLLVKCEMLSEKKITAVRVFWQKGPGKCYLISD